MLGFRGHFATKTRRYSTTLGCLRGAREQWRNQHTLRAHNIDPATPIQRVHLGELDSFDSHADVVLIVGNWTFAGRGHSPGEAIYARTIANDLANSRCIARRMANDEER
jgi:hypothetical protein